MARPLFLSDNPDLEGQQFYLGTLTGTANTSLRPIFSALAHRTHCQKCLRRPQTRLTRAPDQRLRINHGVTLAIQDFAAGCSELNINETRPSV